jgi:uncharacterized protein (DUF1697 family)
MATQVALLRGINVGGKNKLPMVELAALFEESGCTEVRTFIQSGNVIFRAPKKTTARLAGIVAEKIAQRYGYRTPVILRSMDQMREVAAGNPFPGGEENLHVMFLQDRPNAQQIAVLDPDRSPPERFMVRGAEVYLHLLLGAGQSKLTNAWFDSRLTTVSTIRNWRTVTKLLELMEE